MTRLFASALLLSCAATTCAAKPNVLFLLIDDLGFNDMGFSQQLNGCPDDPGSAGAPGVKTPTLDALAHSGVLLNNYYVDTVCSPTRATVMTGRYPIHNTIDDYVVSAKTTLHTPLHTPPPRHRRLRCCSCC